MFTLVARGPQGYRVVRYNAFRYLDLKEGSDAQLQLRTQDMKRLELI